MNREKKTKTKRVWSPNLETSKPKLENFVIAEKGQSKIPRNLKLKKGYKICTMITISAIGGSKVRISGRKSKEEREKRGSVVR